MSLERHSYLHLPYGQSLVGPKLSLAELQSRCAARLTVPSFCNSSSSPHLNGVGSKDDENVGSRASHSRRYSILSCSNDLEYISLFNQEVMKVRMSPLSEDACLFLPSPCLSHCCCPPPSPLCLIFPLCHTCCPIPMSVIWSV